MPSPAPSVPTDPAEPLAGGAFSRLWSLPGPNGEVVVKLGPARLVRHEARALERVAGLGVAPPLIAVGEGVLVTPRLPGRNRRLADLELGSLARLGALVRRIHELEHADAGAIPEWERTSSTLADYRARRAAALLAAPGPRADLVERVVAATVDRDPPRPRAFRRLHGDLWGGNTVWDEDEPTLVDWEYSHLGDPAFELAYAAEMDAMGDVALGALLEGYGDPGIAPRVAAWRPLIALESALWYEAVGDPGRAAELAAQAERQVVRGIAAAAPRTAPPTRRG